MAKIIYTLKIALFQTQHVKMGLGTQNTMDKITSLASFLSLFYIKNWCTASVIANAPIHALELWNQIESMKNPQTSTLKLFPPLYRKFANSAQEKLERHLWYVSKKHVVFSLFSEKLSMIEKTKMWQKLQSYRQLQ